MKYIILVINSKTLVHSRNVKSHEEQAYFDSLMICGKHLQRHECLAGLILQLQLHSTFASKFPFQLFSAAGSLALALCIVTHTVFLWLW